jgi:hypothetical protein
MTSVNTQTVTTSNSVLQKLYDKFYIYVVSENNSYIMTSSICNTSRQTFFSHDSTSDLRHETQSVPRYCAKHITGDEQHRHISQQTKTKVSIKELSMRNRTQQTSLVTLQIKDMLKHESRFMTNWGITLD